MRYVDEYISPMFVQPSSKNASRKMLMNNRTSEMTLGIFFINDHIVLMINIVNIEWLLWILSFTKVRLLRLSIEGMDHIHLLIYIYGSSVSFSNLLIKHHGTSLLQCKCTRLVASLKPLCVHTESVSSLLHQQYMFLRCVVPITI